MATAVVGHPIAHSRSPLLHNTVYEREHIDAHMNAYDTEDIASFVETIRATPLYLTAVTLPHKRTIMPLLDSVDSEASAIGAVNTVINTDGVLVGYNTDITGIRAALKDVVIKEKNVLVIGAGGAAQTVAYFLKEQGAHMFCLNRDLGAAEKLCARFGGIVIRSPEELLRQHFEILVNATSLGLDVHDPLPVPPELISDKTTVFDLIYTRTPLLAAAADRGARTISGLSMFIAQGLEQERLLLGREIADRGYTALLQAELEKRTTG